MGNYNDWIFIVPEDLCSSLVADNEVGMPKYIAMGIPYKLKCLHLVPPFLSYPRVMGILNVLTTVIYKVYLNQATWAIIIA